MRLRLQKRTQEEIISFAFPEVQQQTFLQTWNFAKKCAWIKTTIPYPFHLVLRSTWMKQQSQSQ